MSGDLTCSAARTRGSLPLSIRGFPRILRTVDDSARLTSIAGGLATKRQSYQRNPAARKSGRRASIWFRSNDTGAGGRIHRFGCNAKIRCGATCSFLLRVRNSGVSRFSLTRREHRHGALSQTELHRDQGGDHICGCDSAGRFLIISGASRSPSEDLTDAASHHAIRVRASGRRHTRDPYLAVHVRTIREGP